MQFGLLIILSIPFAVLIFLHGDLAREIAIQLAAFLALFIIGQFLVKSSGCLKIIGLILIILALVLYFLCAINPFFSHQIFVLRL